MRGSQNTPTPLDGAGCSFVPLSCVQVAALDADTRAITLVILPAPLEPQKRCLIRRQSGHLSAKLRGEGHFDVSGIKIHGKDSYAFSATASASLLAPESAAARPSPLGAATWRLSERSSGSHPSLPSPVCFLSSALLSAGNALETRLTVLVDSCGMLVAAPLIRGTRRRLHAPHAVSVTAPSCQQEGRTRASTQTEREGTHGPSRSRLA
jgi:hypothetical protein